MSAGKAAEGVPGATTKKVVLVCPYASCLGFSGRSQRKPTLGDAGSVQASRGDVRSARSGEGGQGRMHGEAVTCHLSKEVFCSEPNNKRVYVTHLYLLCHCGGRPWRRPGTCCRVGGRGNRVPRSTEYARSKYLLCMRLYTYALRRVIYVLLSRDVTQAGLYAGGLLFPHGGAHLLPLLLARPQPPLSPAGAA